MPPFARTYQLLLCASVAGLVMAANAFALYLFRRKERAHLWYGLFCLSLAFRAWVSGGCFVPGAFPAMGIDLLVRLEYLSVALPLLFLALFLAALFPLEAKRWPVIAVSVPVAAGVFLGLPFASLEVLEASLSFLYPLAVAAGFVPFLAILMPALRRKREGALPVSVGAFVLLASFVNDGLNALHLAGTGDLLGYGLLAFVLVQAAVLASRYAGAERRLEESLAERELLVRETHHRVKNSLQIVSSTLGLQSCRAEDPRVSENFSMARRRIQAIGLVHDKLCKVESPDLIDLGDYVRDLVDHLHSSFGSAPGVGSITVSSETIHAKVDDCVDLGLILTELVANACKHAPVAERPVTILVDIRRSGDLVALAVEDDGPGFPPGFDLSKHGSLGYRVVQSLARKHGGEAVFAQGRGTGARVELSLEINRN